MITHITNALQKQTSKVHRITKQHMPDLQRQYNINLKAKHRK